MDEEQGTVVNFDEEEDIAFLPKTDGFDPFQKLDKQSVSGKEFSTLLCSGGERLAVVLQNLLQNKIKTSPGGLDIVFYLKLYYVFGKFDNFNETNYYINNINKLFEFFWYDKEIYNILWFQRNKICETFPEVKKNLLKAYTSVGIIPGRIHKSFIEIYGMYPNPRINMFTPEEISRIISVKQIVSDENIEPSRYLIPVCYYKKVINDNERINYVFVDSENDYGFLKIELSSTRYSFSETVEPAPETPTKRTRGSRKLTPGSTRASHKQTKVIPGLRENLFLRLLSSLEDIYCNIYLNKRRESNIYTQSDIAMQSRELYAYLALFTE